MENTHTPKGEFYNLRWTNYLNNLAETVFNHQSLEKLVDVTLVCEGQVIRAHKLILSSCSEFFQELFKPGSGVIDIAGLNSSIIHPVVVMNGIKYNHLKHIVDFIYQGEIRVLDYELEGVLALGDSMQIKGLSSVKLKQKSQQDNAREINSQNKTESLKVDHKTSPNKIIKSGSSFQSTDKINKPQVASPISSQLAKQTSPAKSIPTNHQQESADTILKTEKASKPVSLVNTLEESKKLITDLLKQETPKQNPVDVNNKPSTVEKVDSHARIHTLAEQNIEPKLKRIKYSSGPGGPLRTYEKNKKDLVAYLPEIKESSASTVIQSSNDDEKKDNQIPRPPNAFMIFANDWRKKLSVEHPDENNKDISIRLGNLWKSLSLETKVNYYEEATKILKEHKAKYPDPLPCIKKNKKTLSLVKKIVSVRKSLPGPENNEALSEGSLEVINCDLEESDSNSRDTIHSSMSN